EFLLKMIFKNYQIEVRDTKHVFNGVACTVRIHYKNPVDGQWYYHGGVGAAEIATKSGASAAEMAKVNQTALATSATTARTEAREPLKFRQKPEQEEAI